LVERRTFESTSRKKIVLAVAAVDLGSRVVESVWSLPDDDTRADETPLPGLAIMALYRSTHEDARMGCKTESDKEMEARSNADDAAFILFIIFVVVYVCA
jgi:hypothetical protein